MNDWRFVIEETGAGAAHMARDMALASEGVAAVRFFRWEPPAVSTGWKQTRPAWLESAQWRRTGLDAVERPTGGGIAFHGSDVSISVVVPRALDVPVATLLHAVCESAARLCETYGVKATVVDDMASSTRITYCLTETSPYAVMIAQRKVAGFALRRYPESWLIQGSLLVRPFPEAMERALPAEVVESVRRRAVSLAEASGALLTEAAVAQRWLDHWALWWEELLTQELGASCP